jgi:hypothetical protein
MEHGMAEETAYHFLKNTWSHRVQRTADPGNIVSFHPFGV